MGYLDAGGETEIGNHCSWKLQTPELRRLSQLAWKDFDKSGIKKKAKELGITPELGPEIEGYQDDHFQDEVPQGAEAEVDHPEFAPDLSA